MATFGDETESMLIGARADVTKWFAINVVGHACDAALTAPLRHVISRIGDFKEEL